jgi:FkbM family methyltransferase
LSPVSMLDRNLIRGETHDPFVGHYLTIALANGGHFIDIGANNGYFTVMASRLIGLRGHVYAFEPSPRELVRLKRNLQINHCRNVSVFAVALGDRSEIKPFYISGLDNPATNTEFRATSNQHAMIVQFLPLMSLIAKEDLCMVRLVKIDVEGGECSVLNGLAACMPWLREACFIVEIGREHLKRADCQPEDIYEFFDRFGFRPILGLQREERYDDVFVAQDNN